MITPEIRNSPFFTICCCAKMRLELLRSLLLWAWFIVNTMLYIYLFAFCHARTTLTQLFTLYSVAVHHTCSEEPCRARSLQAKAFPKPATLTASPRPHPPPQPCHR